MAASAVALVVSGVFVVLSAWHVFMALAPAAGRSGAVPSVEGRPLFVPSRRATLAVAAGLLLFALLVAATAGLLDLGMSRPLLAWLCYALAAGLLGRAIGEFRYVGFFKRVRGSRFATLDTLLYSPLCLVLSGAVAFVATEQA
jgi:hypothetical protein